MKVLLINGSPHIHGCTFTALSEVEKELNKEGIDTELISIGTKTVGGCIGCGQCWNAGKCVVYDDIVNVIAEKAKVADGFVFGSPVSYASANGSFDSLLSRLFYSNGSVLAYKPGAAVVSARRAGTTAAIDQLTKYFTINNMPVVSSRYWPMVHGMHPDEVRRDLEGMQVMRVLGRNMAWLLKCIEAGKSQGIQLPEQEEPEWTNFIR
ncbi:MAG: flavodoxin family protein [Bacteroidales bacterium]|nr:flavodoxin family protein [Bacteroidales bacterium]